MEPSAMLKPPKPRRIRLRHFRFFDTLPIRTPGWHIVQPLLEVVGDFAYFVVEREKLVSVSELRVRISITTEIDSLLSSSSNFRKRFAAWVNYRINQSGRAV